MHILFAYVHLDEWFHWRMLSRAHHAQTNNMGQIIRNILIQRLQDLIAIWLKLDIHEFWQVFVASKACISGSIFLELLLGQDKFKAHDLDIFVVTDFLQGVLQNWPYRPIHRMLWNIMVKNGFVAANEIMRGELATSDNRASIGDGNALVCAYEDWNTSTLADVQISSNRIARMHTYTVQFQPCAPEIQVVSLKSTSNVNDNDAVHVIQHYIHENFDFRCCTNSFDGKSLQIGCISDIFNRKLVLMPQRQERILFFTQEMCTRYNERLSRYEAREFYLDQPYHFGRYQDVLPRVVSQKRYRWKNNQMREKDSECKFTFSELKPICESWYMQKHKEDLAKMVALERQQLHLTSNQTTKRKRENEEYLIIFHR